MGWKKEYKKMMKENTKKSSIFDYSDGISSDIVWLKTMESPNYWNLDNLLEHVSIWNKKIKDILSSQEFPNSLKTYTWKLKSIDTTEEFLSYPMTSFFKETYGVISKKLGSYEAVLIMACLTKFSYYTTDKFWNVFNHTFANKNINDKPLIRVFEVIQRTALDAVDGIIEKAFLLIGSKKVDPYKHHLLIEEILDLGDDFTYHWSRMLEQVIELTVESFVFENEFGQTNSSTHSSSYSDFFDTGEDDFEDFFEKTKTLVFNEEVNEALDYFGLTRISKPDDLKKAYRKLAKIFHPDLNNDPNAAIEMKKINIFKEIIETYYEKFELN